MPVLEGFYDGDPEATFLAILDMMEARRITIDAPGFEMPCTHCGASLSVRLAPGAWAILNCGEVTLLVMRASSP